MLLSCKSHKPDNSAGSGEKAENTENAGNGER
jgi:hypothetical protein